MSDSEEDVCRYLEIELAKLIMPALEAGHFQAAWVAMGGTLGVMLAQRCPQCRARLAADIPHHALEAAAIVLDETREGFTCH